MDGGALNEGIVFLDHFAGLEDPRQPGKVIYPLNEALLLCLLAVLAGAETFTDIALFGEKKLHLLRRFLPYRSGTPPHDRLGEIFAALDAEAFQRCFVSWVSAITKIPAEVIAIDGKTSRRSFKKKGAERHNWPGLKAIVMVESRRETGTKIETETLFTITSLEDSAERIASAVRCHPRVKSHRR